MIEFERTFLVKGLPSLAGCRRIEVIDIYYPADAEHPVLRLRKKGERYELTKKVPIRGTDSSEQKEDTIPLTKEEFDALSSIEGKRVEKVRYYIDHSERKVEIDIFAGALSGLVIADFEFATKEEKDALEMPGFCLVEITQEKLLAGGMLCGKSYEDIEPLLESLGYKKIISRHP